MRRRWSSSRDAGAIGSCLLHGSCVAAVIRLPLARVAAAGEEPVQRQPSTARIGAEPFRQPDIARVEHCPVVEDQAIPLRIDSPDAPEAATGIAQVSLRHAM